MLLRCCCWLNLLAVSLDYKSTCVFIASRLHSAHRNRQRRSTAPHISEAPTTGILIWTSIFFFKRGPFTILQHHLGVGSTAEPDRGGSVNGGRHQQQLSVALQGQRQRPLVVAPALSRPWNRVAVGIVRGAPGKVPTVYI